MSTMATTTSGLELERTLVTTPVRNTAEDQWYAAYTFAKHEKRVAQQLNERRIESFLPTYRAIRKWKDRQKALQLPLFPSYVFIRIDIKDRLRVQQVPGVVSLVSFGGSPVPLRSSDVETLRQGSANPTQIAPHPYLKVGRRVRVRGGPFAGTEGILMRRRNGCRVVVAIDLLRRSVAVEADEADLVPIQ